MFCFVRAFSFRILSLLSRYVVKTRTVSPSVSLSLTVSYLSCFHPISALFSFPIGSRYVRCKNDWIQLAGYVRVMFAHGMKLDRSSKPKSMKAKEIIVVPSMLPVQCVGKHFCYHNKNIDKNLYRVLVHALNPLQAIRFRFNYGMIEECVYNSMMYGILHGTIPIAS